MIFVELLRRFNYEIIGYSPEWQEKTWELYQKVFGGKSYSPYIRSLTERERVAEIWRWRFPQETSVRLLTIKNEEVIGHLGAWIREIDVFGEQILGAEMIEGLVDSLFRNGPAFYLLVQKMQVELESRGVKFAFLFPNQFSERVVLKKSAAVREAFLLEKSLMPEWHDTHSFLADWKYFPEKASQIFVRNLGLSVIASRRTPEFIRWRFGENLCETYFPILLPDEKGYAILKIYNNEKAHIVDLVAEDLDSFGSLLSKTERIAKSYGAKTISLYPICEPWTGWVRDFGYQQKNWGRKMAIICPDKEILPARKISYWYLQMCEHSIF